MDDIKDFLAVVLPRHVTAAEALHNGDPEPLSDLLAKREPTSLFPGMADHRTGRAAVTEVFREIAPRFTNCTPLTFEVVSADVRGDLGYVIGYEHSRVSIDGRPQVANDLRVTHIYRREDGAWRLVHRHGGGGPAGSASD